MVQRAVRGVRPSGGGGQVAELACFHDQPLPEPAATGGAAGATLDCPACDRAELPGGLTHLRTAGPWDQDTLPAGLQRAHRVAEGVWGVLRVLDGVVRFDFEGDAPRSVTLEPGGSQPIPPGVPHHVTLGGPARLAVEFWGRPQREVAVGLEPRGA